LNLALDEEALYRRRCVEIKHGRIAMAAVVGLLVAVTWMLVNEGVTGQSTAEQLACGLV
jgi:hypothetical protein